MTRQTLAVLAAATMGAMLVVGAGGAWATPGNGNGGGNGQPNAHELAAKACSAQKQAIGNKAFKAFYGKHAQRNCMAQQGSEIKNAAHECKAEQADAGFAAGHGGATFAEFYGKNANDKNAFGKCVSGKVRAQQAAEQEQLLNAAQQCKAERSDPNFAAGHDGKSFADFYGTNANKKNAFGKCVSKKAHEANQGSGTA